MVRPRDIDYLQPEETVVLQAHRHPLSVVDGLIWMALAYLAFCGAALAVAYVWLHGAAIPVAWSFTGVATGVLLAGVVALHWRRATSLYTVTGDRVYMAYGRLRFILLQTTFDKVTDLHLHQSLWGRIWDFGTIRVQTAGTGLALAGVQDPVAFKKRIEACREAFLHGLLSEHAPVEAGAPTARPRGEAETLWTGRPSPASFLGGALGAAILFLAGTGLAIGGALAGSPAGWWAFGLIAMAGITVWTRWIQYRYTRFEVSDRGVALTRGWLSRRRVEATFAKVTDVAVEQDVLARLLGYGRITINTAGSNEAPVVFHGVARPDEAKAIIDRARRGAGG